MFINLATIIITLYAYITVYKVSYAVSSCVPTGKLTKLISHILNLLSNILFDYSYLASYQIPSMSSRFYGTYRCRKVGSSAESLWNSCQNESVDKFSQQK